MNENRNTEIELMAAWEKLAAEKFSSDTFNKIDIMEAIQKDSNSTIIYLSTGLKHKIRFSIGFSLLFILLTYINREDVLDMYFCISLVVAYLVGAFFMNLHYKKILVSGSKNMSLLERMKTDLRHIRSTLKVEAIWGVIVFLSITAYYMYRVIMKNNDNPEKLAVVLIVMSLVISFFAYASIKMNEMRFGKEIKKLEENIIRLETLK